MIWFVGIMLVAVALVVGPVMMMRPDAVQRKKEKMRAIAFAKGIRFSLKKLPQQATETEAPTPIPVYFFAPSNSQQENGWLLLRATYEHEILYLRGWAWQDDSRATEAEQAVLKKYLPILSDDVRAVSVGRQGVCVYWYEKGGEPELAKIMELLQQLKSLQV